MFSQRFVHELLTVWKSVIYRAICTNVDPTLIADQRNFSVKYLQNGEENKKCRFYLIFASS